jgi:hypothetical protein
MYLNEYITPGDNFLAVICLTLIRPGSGGAAKSAQFRPQLLTDNGTPLRKQLNLLGLVEQRCQ